MSEPKSLKEKIILALDLEDLAEVRSLVRELKNEVEMFKLGYRLLVPYGPRVVEVVKEEGGKVFYDGKFMDIPSVVKEATRRVAEMGVDMLTLHLLGGERMIEEGVEGARMVKEDILILGVTILTSLGEEDLPSLGIEKKLSEEALNLTLMGKKKGVSGVVCSPRELSILRKRAGKDFLLVTPGIRPPWLPPQDQRRTLTPQEAFKKGADFIVLGRAVLHSPNPQETLRKILSSCVS